MIMLVVNKVAAGTFWYFHKYMGCNLTLSKFLSAFPQEECRPTAYSLILYASCLASPSKFNLCIT